MRQQACLGGRGRQRGHDLQDLRAEGRQGGAHAEGRGAEQPQAPLQGGLLRLHSRIGRKWERHRAGVQATSKCEGDA